MIRNRVAAGAMAGLLAGVVFGIMMQVMKAPATEGGQVSMMTMVAMVVRSQNLMVGWIYPLLLGMPPFAALRMPPMRPVAMGSFFGHLIYGVILGATYVRLHQPAAAPPPFPTPGG